MNNHPARPFTIGHLTRREALLAGGCGAALAALPLTISGCGGGSSALDVPFVTRVFEGVVADTAGTDLIIQLNLDFSGTLAGKSSGTIDDARITITDRVNNTPYDPVPATGTLTGNSFTLNTPTGAAPLSTAYDGEFVEADTIVLTPRSAGQPTLRLVRVDGSFRPALDASIWQGTDANKKPWTINFLTRPDGDTGNGTELLRGTDSLGGQAGSFTGYSAMRQLQITVTRGAAPPVTLTGRFGPSGTTPPVETTQALATTLRFADGSTLTRTSPLP